MWRMSLDVPFRSHVVVDPNVGKAQARQLLRSSCLRIVGGTYLGGHLGSYINRITKATKIISPCTHMPGQTAEMFTYVFLFAP